MQYLDRSRLPSPSEEHPELGVLTWFRPHLDRSAKQLDDPPAEIEAEAGTLDALAARQPDEALEPSFPERLLRQPIVVLA